MRIEKVAPETFQTKLEISPKFCPLLEERSRKGSIFIQRKIMRNFVKQKNVSTVGIISFLPALV